MTRAVTVANLPGDRRVVNGGVGLNAVGRRIDGDGSRPFAGAGFLLTSHLSLTRCGHPHTMTVGLIHTMGVNLSRLSRELFPNRTSGPRIRSVSVAHVSVVPRPPVPGSGQGAEERPGDSGGAGRQQRLWERRRGYPEFTFAQRFAPGKIHLFTITRIPQRNPRGPEAVRENPRAR